METPTISITMAPGQEKAIVGSEILQLADRSAGTFKTNNIKAFNAYVVKAMADKGQAVVYHDNENAWAYADARTEYDTHPVAILEIEHSKIVEYLLNINGKKFKLDDFEDVIRTIRPWLTGDKSAQMLDFTSNMTVQKVKTITRQQDHQGNFQFAVSSEKGKNDFDFPKEIALSIQPLQDDKEFHFVVKFEIFVTWVEVEGIVQLFVMLKNLLLEEHITDAIGYHVAMSLKENTNAVCFRGTFDIKRQLDNWRTQANPLRIKRD